MKKGSRKEKGFTLVELLVVIAIMATLIGVAVGSFTGLIGTGQNESKNTEKVAVQTAVDTYISVSPTHTLAARTVAAVIDTGDTDAPFKIYLRSLPTKYSYTWTVYPNPVPGGDPGGLVTQAP